MYKPQIELKRSISHSTIFDTQRQLADFLGIKNSSKKAIEARCRVMGMETCFEY
jgi:DNA-binding XRE family transcriptional regulator